MYNTPTQTLILQKYVSGTTEPIEGVRFHVTDQTGSPVGASNGDFVTDSNGQITITGLTPGSTVTAVETETAEGFVLDSKPQSILIREGEVQRMLFFNSPKGSLHVFKMDSVTERPLADAEFRITGSVIISLINPVSFLDSEKFVGIFSGEILHEMAQKG